jgi:hypothetical protein
MRNIYFNLICVMAVFIVASGCEEYEYKVPEAKTHLQNDAIKRSLGPNVVGQDIEFVYAMALGYGRGKLLSAEVEASIPGATGTYLEHRAFHTGSGGNDIPVQIGEPSTTTGAKTVVNFSTDTVAAALRYFYRIPEAARGKSVEFTFTSKASTGESVSYRLGPFHIANMEMKLDVTLSDGNLAYFSIEDMQAYNAADAAANSSKIDLVYLYRPITGINFNHALVAPTTHEDYRPDVTLPSGVNNNTKMRRVWQLQDRHLARLQYGIYIDDPDFVALDMSNPVDYALHLRAESGVWVETADGKYRAYVYVNAVNNSAKTMRVSIKRYQMR